jgi:hypothetical protein
MTERREFEGTGYHYFDGNEDCLLVNQWIKRPEDSTGQSIPVSKLLPRSVRCTNPDNHDGGYIGIPRGNPPGVLFRFRITVEIEKLFVRPK